MKSPHLAVLCFLSLGLTAGLRAQTAQTQYSPAPSGLGLTGAVVVPYTFHWNGGGISAEVGKLWNETQFIGGEVSYYGGDVKTYDAYSDGAFVKRFRSRQRVTTAEVAYRYFIPITDLNGSLPVRAYLGAGAGVGFVDYSNANSTFGFSGASRTDANPAGELLAGIQATAWHGIGLRLGYRYVALAHVLEFTDHHDIGTGALEAGLAFRF
ncbi:MAG TPA: outer membrane beta-barrel protein [Opitutaceae bacterium]|nr:outer membrane beta-barrel protein [Opitutaceae bacterium]